MPLSLKIKTLQLFFFCLLSALSYGQSESDQHIILEKIKKTSSETEKMELFHQLANINRYTNTEKSIFYAKNASDIAKKIGTPNEQAFYLTETATHIAIDGNVIDGIQLQLHILSAYPNIEDTTLIKIYNTLGLFFYNIKESDLATKYAQKAIALSDSINQSVLALLSLANLGKINLYLNQYDKSLEYFKQAKKTSITTNNSIPLNYIQKDLTQLFLLRNELGLAKKCATDAINLSLKNNSPLVEGHTRINLSNILRKELKYSEAILEAKKGIALLEKFNPQILLEGKKSLIKTKVALKKIDEALSIAFSSLEISKNNNIPKSTFDFYELISSIYKNKNEYKKALVYSEKAIAINNEINKEKQFQSSLLTEKILDNQQIINENKILKEQIKATESNTQKSKVFGIVMAIFFLLTLGLAFLIYHKKGFKYYTNSFSYKKNDKEIRFQFIRNALVLSMLLILPLILYLFYFENYLGLINVGWFYFFALSVIFLIKKKKENLAFYTLLFIYSPPTFSPLTVGELHSSFAIIYLIFLVIYFFKPNPKYQILNFSCAILAVIVQFYILNNYELAIYPFAVELDALFMIIYFLLIILVLLYLSKNIHGYRRELIKKNDFLNQIADLNPHFIYAKDKNRAFSFVNKPISLSLGLSKVDILGKTNEELIEILNPANKKLLEEVIGKYKIDDLKVINDKKSIVNKESLMVSPDGTKTWVLTTKVPIFNQDEEVEVEGLLAVGINITRQKLITEKLSESERRYRKLFDLSFDGLIFINSDGNIFETNSNAIDLFGEDILISKKSIDKYIPDFPTQINLEEFFKGEDFFSKTYRLNGLNALNEIITLEVSLFKIENPQGKNQIACAIKNITNQIILEIKEKELLSQKQELASLNNEIVAQTIFVNTKNKLLNELKNDASAIIPLVQGKGKQELNRLTRKIGANINEDENFFSFKLKFEKTHPNFFKNIETIHPKLTNNDLKLCAYIRLGMTSQDIANLQFIEKRSVEMSKYRLKKKLELQGEDDLNQFINTM